MRSAPALLAVLALLGGCGGDESIDEAVADAEVVVIGDSVTDASAEEIVAAMADREVEVLGRPGYRTDELLPVAEEALAGDGPAIAVVMAGYNDVWQGRDREAPVAELVEAVAGADCAVWVLVPTEGPWDRGRARALERRVQEAAEETGVAIETGWRDAVDATEVPDPGLVVPDGVHPSEAGQRKLAEVMAAAVDRWCG